MLPSVVYKIPGAYLPELSPSALTYMDGVYENMQVETDRDAFIEVMDSPNVVGVFDEPDVEDLVDTHFVEDTLGYLIAEDMRLTYNDNYGLQKSRLGLAEVRRRTILGEIMLKGERYENRAIWRGVESLEEPYNPRLYSPKLTARFATLEVRDIIGSDEVGDYNKFRRGIVVPKILRLARQNRV